MHTFKNLVKHKRSSTCFCGMKRREEEKGKNNFKKNYRCACQVYECRLEFSAKPGTEQLESLKSDLEKSAVRIVLVDLLPTCQGTVESRHCLFTLICQGCMQEYWQKISPHCTPCLYIPSAFSSHRPCAVSCPHARLYWCPALMMYLC